MKKLIMLGLLGLSAQAFGQTCYVDLVIKNSHSVVRTFSAYGDQMSCIEGMKECRKAIRFEYSNHPQYPSANLDCINSGDFSPIPTPTPTPNPYPQHPSQTQYPTNLIIGETVYNVSNNRYAEVVARDSQGKFMLRYRDNNSTGTGWSRSDLAPARGCDGDLCVNDMIYNHSNNRYAQIVGLQMTGKFVLKYSDNNLTGSGWNRSDLAVMKGCSGDICVSDDIYNVSNNRYARVVGIQQTGKFVLKYNDNALTGSGWNRSDLAVKKGCQSNICVGNRVFNSSNNRYARVEALQQNGKFVLRYEDNNLTGSGWTVNNIIVVR